MGWLGCGDSLPAKSLQVGFAETDITPQVGERPVWMAGYLPGRPASGVHDPLMARCLVLRDGTTKMAFVSVDLIGLQLPTVKLVRGQLADFTYVMVSSTHNHEGPDTIGLWGRLPVERGVDEDYLETVVAALVKVVRAAEQQMVAVHARYGTAADDTLLRDGRLPHVYDGVLRVLVFDSLAPTLRKPAPPLPRDMVQPTVSTDPPAEPAAPAVEIPRSPAGLLVQWNCHPETLGASNRLITADFPAATVAALRKQYKCPVVYLSGAVGGLMAPPVDRIKDAAGETLKEGDFQFATAYGQAVAALASQAIDKAEPLRLTPMVVSAKPIGIPLENKLYRLAKLLGVVTRQARAWNGEFEPLGEIIERPRVGQPSAVETEVGYLRLGELHIACIPGEIYPELVYGKFQEPVDPGADFPEAPLEQTVVKILPGDKWMLFGLANDELGYIIPKRQWDSRRPYAYERTSAQYGEINSCGPEVAPIIMQALERRVREIAPNHR